MMSEQSTFSIHEISERSGLSKDTIRYYEKIGLLPVRSVKQVATGSIRNRTSRR